MLWDDADRAAETGTRRRSCVPDDKIKRVVICSGKVYYDLLEERDARGIDDVYLMRLEQFYPFPALSLDQGARPLQAGADRLVPGGAEEPGRLDLRRAEPRMGARPHRAPSTAAPVYVGRPAAASPATGLAREHKAQQEALVDEALTVRKDR